MVNRVRNILLIPLVAILSACANGEQNFSQFPGFSEYFQKNVPRTQAANATEKALLEKYKPKIFIASDQATPIDFYADYIGNGKLLVDGKLVSQDVTPQLLNAEKDNIDAVFQYTGKSKVSSTPTLYARIDYEQVEHQNTTFEFTFLNYNVVYPVSGILEGLSFTSRLGLSIVGNLVDWHQLDHYLSVTIALLDGEAVAYTLQQHNYHTTYFIKDPLNPIAVDIAIRSNELYPHSKDKTEHPAVSFMTADNIEFLVSGKNKPMMAGYDITHGEIELQYSLEYLAPADAFYQFKGTLGKRRLLPGRSGPPGADYATLPGLMPRSARLFTGYRTTDAKKEAALLANLINMEKFAVKKEAINAYKTRWFQQLAK